MRSARTTPRLAARALQIAFVSALIAIATPASAVEPVRLSWVRGEGAETCAPQETIAAGVTARLGEGALSQSAQRSIEALVTRAPTGFRATLYVRNPDGSLAGSREITSESEACASIETASVLAIALAIDPDAATRPPPSAPSLPAPTAAPPPRDAAPFPPDPKANPIAPPTAPIAPSSPIIASQPMVRSAPTPLALATDTGGAGLSLRAGIGIGLLPTPALVLDLGGHVALGPRVEITGEALWTPETRTADRITAFGLTAFSVGVCGTLSRARSHDFGVCGAVWGGSLHSVVYNIAPISPGDSAWAALSLTPRVRLRLPAHLHLDLGAHALVPLTRHVFQFEDGTRIFQQTIVTVTPYAGVGVHFL